VEQLSKQWMGILIAAVLVQGCASVNGRGVPVVDAGAPVPEEVGARQAYRAPAPPSPQQAFQESGAVVMPQGESVPLQTFPAPDTTFSGTIDTPPAEQERWEAPSQPQPPSVSQQPSAPSGIPSAGGLSADEQLDGPVLALLTTAQQQQGGGDLNGAASSLERAQRIAPREPQVLYRLAQVRLAQGDAVQAEQLSRRGLSYASGRPALQASLWELIARAREQRGDAAGAAQARERARVSM